MAFSLKTANGLCTEAAMTLIGLRETQHGSLRSLTTTSVRIYEAHDEFSPCLPNAAFLFRGFRHALNRQTVGMARKVLKLGPQHSRVQGAATIEEEAPQIGTAVVKTRLGGHLPEAPALPLRVAG